MSFDLIGKTEILTRIVCLIFPDRDVIDIKWIGNTLCLYSEGICQSILCCDLRSPRCNPH